MILALKKEMEWALLLELLKKKYYQINWDSCYKAKLDADAYFSVCICLV